MAISSTATSTPNLENHFFLPIWDVYENPMSRQGDERIWRNPHLNTIIKPYIPEDNKKLIETFKSTISINTQNSSSAEEIVFSCRDVASLILSYPDLSLTDVITFSTVNKNCYLATKADVVWKMRLCKLLPQVKFISQELCTFTLEQQYKIIFKRITDECKPYIAKFIYNQKRLLELGNELEKTKSEFNNAGGSLELRNELEKTTSELDNVGDMNADEMFALKLLENMNRIRFHGQSSQNFPIIGLSTKLHSLTTDIFRIVGKGYNSSIESFDPNSDQGRIKHGIAVLVPEAFNNQMKFEEVIRMSEAIANRSSLNSEGPTVEDITDVEDTDPISGETDPTSGENG